VLVIAASALGTAFEWYDFFVYGTLASVIGVHFFPAGNAAVSLLIALATFGVGFGMRPVGAVLFGVLGDRLGRKYTFLATVALMGGATAGVGLLPTFDRIGLAAPILLVLLRVAQGLALGGEYGGAAVYVAEHAPAGRRGFYTSFIQAGVAGGFLLSLGVVLAASRLLGPAAWIAWGWRVPFLFSLALLALSLWVRSLLHESPVFRAMAAAGTVARNPLAESLNSGAKLRRLAVVLFGVAAGLTVIFYTAQFQTLYFLGSAVGLDDTAARLIVGAGVTVGMGWFILFGWLSDRIGRKPPIIAGYLLTLVFLFPLFHWMAAAGNPALAAARAKAPVTVQGSDCRFDPFAAHGQPTACGRLLDALSRRGVAYTKQPGPAGASPQVSVGGRPVADGALDAALARAGYPAAKRTPNLQQAWPVVVAVALVGLLAGMTFGPVAALLPELFPANVRYTSLSIPYHLGTGYFGGFLPFINQYVVARTGDPFAGLWYVEGVVALALVVAWFGLPETKGVPLA
jgi:MFS family permease